MIKLHQFALNQGVSDRQVQRLIVKYGDEIEGLYERRGHNGTWLSEEACEILKGKMRVKENEVYDASKDREIERLNERIKELESVIKSKEMHAATLEAARQADIEKIEEFKATMLLLEEKNQVEVDNLQKMLNTANEKIETLREEKDDLQKEIMDKSNEIIDKQKELIEKDAELEAEKSRKLTIKEAFTRVIGKKEK